MGSGVDKRQLGAVGVRRAAGIGLGQRAAVLSDKEAGGWVLGANRELAGAEVELVALEQRESAA